MSVRVLAFSITLLILFGCATAQTVTKATKLGIINGRATFLPKPEYSDELKKLCAYGKVEIELFIDEQGRVQQAKAISGDGLLFESAIEAAMKAKFQTYHGLPIKTRGILVYNFLLGNKCVDAGIVNKKALSLPKPVLHTHAIIERPTEILVRVVIDESGAVVAARALKGHPLIRNNLEKAARLAKFPPTFVNPGPIKVKAFIVYKIKPDRTVEF